MGTIYSKASEVIVWLGMGSKGTTDAFNLARQFGNTRAEEHRKHLWEEVTSSRSWGNIRMEFNKILSHEWWTRAWIIQEVAVARRVLVRRGSAQLDWDALQHLFAYRPFQENFSSQSSTDFADAVQQLRNGLFDSVNLTTLFDLVYELRTSLQLLAPIKSTPSSACCPLAVPQRCPPTTANLPNRFSSTLPWRVSRRTRTLL